MRQLQCDLYVTVAWWAIVFLVAGKRRISPLFSAVFNREAANEAQLSSVTTTFFGILKTQGLKASGHYMESIGAV